MKKYNGKELTKEERVRRVNLNKDVLEALGFKKSCNLFLKGGMSIGCNRGYVWLASYKMDAVEDVWTVGDLLKFMEKKGIDNDLGITYENPCSELK